MSHRPGEEPEESDERDEPGKRSGARYSLLVGVAFVALAAIAAYNALSGEEAGVLGTVSTEGGGPMPEFAVPTLLGSQEGDANIFQDDCESSQTPCPADSRRTPACEVELEQVIRVCDFFDRPLVISFWFAQGGQCLPSQDVVDRVAASFGDEVGFLSIDIRDDREDAAKVVAERGWEIPVGWDADGAVSNLYRVGGCPTVAFAYPGGILAGASISEQEVSAQGLTAAVEQLVRDSKLRAETYR
ncbi:MAG: hypothetical protein H0W09_05990 [Solirubrobacterales bacterium]|nr:hypothetical protein [Solirubrobacterales bacterium]